MGSYGARSLKMTVFPSCKTVLNIGPCAVIMGLSVEETRLYDPMICHVHHQVMGNTSEATVFAEIYQCETAQNLATERQ